MMYNTAIVALWVPVVVFAHLFAGFWFIKTFLLYDPRPLAAIRRRRSSGAKLPKACASEDGEDADEDVVLTLDEAAGGSGTEPKHRKKGASGHSMGLPGRLSGAQQRPAHTASDGRLPCPRCSRRSPLPPGPVGGTDQGVSGSAPGQLCDGAAQAAGAAAGAQVERVHLEWQAISCSYNAAAGKLPVLQDIWGQANAGEMQVRRRMRRRGMRSSSLLHCRCDQQRGSACPHCQQQLLWQLWQLGLHTSQHLPANTRMLVHAPAAAAAAAAALLVLLRRRCWAPLAPASPR